MDVKIPVEVHVPDDEAYCAGCRTRLPINVTAAELDYRSGAPMWRATGVGVGPGVARLSISRKHGENVVLHLCNTCGEKARQAVQ
jgi:hypothetical protein